jgi:hypothetical protein
LLGFTNLLGSVFEAVSKSEANQQRIRNNKFNELGYSPFLFSSDYLNEMMDECETKEDHEAILDYMYRFDVCEIDSYKSIEDKIINKYW